MSGGLSHVTVIWYVVWKCTAYILYPLRGSVGMHIFLHGSLAASKKDKMLPSGNTKTWAMMELFKADGLVTHFTSVLTYSLRRTCVRLSLDNTLRACLNPFFPTVPIFAVREIASLGIMGEPRISPLNPPEMIVF